MAKKNIGHIGADPLRCDQFAARDEQAARLGAFPLIWTNIKKPPQCRSKNIGHIGADPPRCDQFAERDTMRGNARGDSRGEQGEIKEEIPEEIPKLV